MEPDQKSQYNADALHRIINHFDALSKAEGKLTSVSRYNSISTISKLDVEALNYRLALEDVLDEDSKHLPNSLGFRSPSSTTHIPGWRKRAQLILPHVGLVLLSCIYTVIGGVTFYFIENPHEVNSKEEGVKEILKTRASVLEKMFGMRTVGNYSDSEWRGEVGDDLDHFMKVVFDAYSKKFVHYNDVYSNSTGAMWTFPSSLFFSATVITTIGYGHLVPHTLTGKILCVIFGLFGIPLILVTVADMGKFLSEYIIGFYKRVAWVASWIRTKLFDCLCRASGLPATPKDGPNGSTHDGNESQLSSGDTKDSEFAEFESEEPKIPVTFILAILVGYTAFGAFLLRLWEDWTFAESFYYCFITVTTIGFGDIVPRKQSYILITLLYIATGLVITTMCIDLIGSQYIRKVHYFGREMKKARYALATVGDKVIHIGQVIRYVTFLQKRYGLTEEQLEKMSNLPDAFLLECLLSGKALPAHLRGLFLRPYVPAEIHLLKYIDQRASCSWTSERVLASLESIDVGSRSTTNRTPRDFYFQDFRDLRDIPNVKL